MAEKPQPPTLRSLASKLGISAATISLALRNDPRVAAATRERVVALAKQEGYHLNPAIASLMSQVRTTRRVAYQETIAWLNFWDDSEAFVRTGVEYQRHMWEGAKERASEFGYNLDSFWMKESGMTPKRTADILRSRGIRGIMIPPLPESSNDFQIDWAQFSAITLSYTFTGAKMNRVVPDHFSNMQIILHKLLERGYRRPGLLMPHGYDERMEHRCMAAYLQMQQTLARLDRIPAKSSDPEVVEESSVLWLDKYRPDVVITMGTLKQIKQLGGIDQAYLNSLGLALMSNAASDEGYCGINENPRTIGTKAVEQLALSLQRNEHGLPEHPTLIQVHGTWLDGSSAPVVHH